MTYKSYRGLQFKYLYFIHIFEFSLTGEKETKPNGRKVPADNIVLQASSNRRLYNIYDISCQAKILDTLFSSSHNRPQVWRFE